MQLKIVMIVCLFLWLTIPTQSDAIFIPDRQMLQRYCGRSDVVMLASSGRSGSTMLTTQLQKYMNRNKVLKTHLLPPESFKGKILFVYSNPDQAAESALFMTLHRATFGERHFNHMETADRQWLKDIGGADKQNEEHNLLSIDALGIYEQLKVWLFSGTQPARAEKANVLAIKYENLWDHETIEAIRSFLKLPHFTLPDQLPRGHKDLFSKEKKFRKIYNLGTKEAPRYAAYDDARCLWEQSPPFQYLRISSEGRPVPSCQDQ